VKYRTIVADPPWPYTPHENPWIAATPTDRPNSWQSDKAGPFATLRYGYITIESLCAMEIPADDNAHLFLWTTNAFVVEAHEVARAWGFKPKTMLTWVKTKHADGSVSMKTGYWFRGATEHVVFGVRGKQRLLTAAAFPTAYLWPRLGHSVKPDAFYDLVEAVSPAPRLELFARRQRLGWDTWGNEALEHVSMEVEVVV
jgi:N6-adenosine-specific RNA methylase IME4